MRSRISRRTAQAAPRIAKTGDMASGIAQSNSICPKQAYAQDSPAGTIVAAGMAGSRYAPSVTLEPSSGLPYLITAAPASCHPVCSPCVELVGQLCEYTDIAPALCFERSVSTPGHHHPVVIARFPHLDRKRRIRDRRRGLFVIAITPRCESSFDRRRALEDYLTLVWLEQRVDMGCFHAISVGIPELERV